MNSEEPSQTETGLESAIDNTEHQPTVNNHQQTVEHLQKENDVEFAGINTAATSTVLESGPDPAPADDTSSSSVEVTRVCLNETELVALTTEQLVKSWHQQNMYIDSIERQLISASALQPESSPDQQQAAEQNAACLRDLEEKLKQQQLVAARRENILIMRLTMREKEIQDYVNQIQELNKQQTQIPSEEQLKATLVDPAVNLIYEKMRSELESSKAKVEEMQNELSAWKFTADSQTGKRLMAKCRLLYQENEELGKLVSSGRVAKLEGDLALQKKLSEEMKKSQSELDGFLLELDEDTEGMQSTIYYLQQQLKEAKQALALCSNKSNCSSTVSNGVEPELNQTPSSSTIITSATSTKLNPDVVPTENGNSPDKDAQNVMHEEESAAMQCD